MIKFFVLLFPVIALANAEQQIELQSRFFVDNKTPYFNDTALSYQSKSHSYLDNGDLIQFNFEAQKSSKDDNRNYINIKELYWLRVKDEWEAKVGINTVFWGKTESINVVDVINQKNLFTSDYLIPLMQMCGYLILGNLVMSRSSL